MSFKKDIGKRMSLQEAGLLWVAVMVVIIWSYGMYENAKQTHYWRGRKDGWDMHRRMIQNKTDADIN
jgi:hypothetical protein